MKNLNFFSILLILLTPMLTHAQKWVPASGPLVPIQHRAFGISAVNDSVVWAATWDFGFSGSVPLTDIPKILRTSNGGASWVVHDIEEAIGRISFDLTAIDSLTAWITTQSLGNGKGRGLFKTEDGGITWNEVFHRDEGGVWLRWFNENDGIAINRHLSAITPDAGLNWSYQTIAGFDSLESTLIYNGSNSCEQLGDRIWFGTDQGNVFRSVDKGANWSKVNVGIGNDKVVYSLAFFDEDNGLALADKGAFQYVLYTTDGGISWNTRPSPPSSLRGLEAIPGKDSAFIATRWNPTGSMSVYSLDFGKSWTTFGPITLVNAVHMLSDNSGWSVGFNKDGIQPLFYKWSRDSLFTFLEELESLKNQIRIYPNPVVESVHIDLSEVEGFDRPELQVFDAGGKLLLQKAIDTEEAIDLSSLPASIYLLKFSFEKGVVSKKVIKRQGLR